MGGVEATLNKPMMKCNSIGMQKRNSIGMQKRKSDVSELSNSVDGMFAQLLSRRASIISSSGYEESIPQYQFNMVRQISQDL